MKHGKHRSMLTGMKRRNLLVGLGVSILTLALLGLLGVRLVYGGGKPYPDHSTPPLTDARQLEVLAELPFPAGNIAASRDGRIFFNLHPFAEPQRYTDTFVFEWVNGKAKPYPNQAFQRELIGVLGMTVDAQNRLWMIRPAGIEDRPTRLLAFDLRSERLVVDYVFPEGLAPFAQDLRVSPDGKTVYLADTGIFRFTKAALVVFDVASRRARRVLEGHPSVNPQDWIIQTREGPHKVLYGLVTFSVGVDGLALSHDGRFLYFASMSHDTLYRIETRFLRDDTLEATTLSQQVRAVSPKPLSDGIEIDAKGNVYLTDIEHGGLARVAPDGTLRTLVRSDDIVWADGIALEASGALLFTDSQIPAYLDPLLLPPARARIDRVAPHRIYRIRP